MFGRRRRQDRRLRERGYPARATILSAEPGGDDTDTSGRLRWDLRLHVVTDVGEAFDASSEALCPVGDVPAVGAEVDVLHDPGHRRRVLLDGSVPTSMSSAALDPPEPTPVDDEGDPPDPLTLVLSVLDGLRDGTTLDVGGVAGVHVDSPRSSRDLTDDEVRNLARTDPAGMAREVLRRITSGEMSLTDATAVKETLGLDGRTVQKIVQDLTTSGSLSPQSLDAIRRAQRDG